MDADRSLVDGVGTRARRLDDLVEMLRFFGPAREHIKTLYVQWELVNLSRGMLLSAVPALVPFILRFAYVLRIATVAKQTLSIGPFILRPTNREESLDWT